MLQVEYIPSSGQNKQLPEAKGNLFDIKNTYTEDAGLENTAESAVALGT